MILVFYVVSVIFMNILIMGAPGSGKGVQASLIKNKFSLFDISVGDLLRKEVLLNSTIGKRIKNNISKGLLVDDKIVFVLVRKKIRRYNSVLLDGFPRTLQQALFLDVMKFKIDYIIKLNVKEAILIKRIKYRLVNNSTNMSYNIIYSKFKIKYKDNVTGASLFTRIDDTYDIFKFRFNKYVSECKSIVEYFINKQVPIIEIDGCNDSLTIFNQIKSEINKYE